VNCFSSKKFT